MSANAARARSDSRPLTRISKRPDTAVSSLPGRPDRPPTAPMLVVRDVPPPHPGQVNAGRTQEGRSYGSSSLSGVGSSWR
ncbi:hypothetical protein GCM10023203_28640 [Actinomycetospora straminea]|uniref:Uncharacterized protein n=1 Tax=Actinomycetospora straminea TaxID=663607 RepID=A0ABP9EG17_9PSEU